MMRFMILLVLAFVAGGVIGHLLAWGRMNDERRELYADYEARKQEWLTMGSARKDVPAVTPDAEVLPAASEPPLGDALKAIAVEPAPAGGGEIRGTARTEAGQPVAGVRVRATPFRPGRTAGRQMRDTLPPGTPSLEDAVREFVRVEAWRRQRIAEGVSGEDGAFVLCGITDDSYQIDGWLEGHDVSPGRWRREGWRAGDTADLTVAVLVELRVTIRKPDGSVPVSATLHLNGSASGRKSNRIDTWWADTPRVLLSPGTYDVRPETGPDREWTCAAQSAVLEAGKPPVELDFLLVARRGIRGRVLVPAHESLSAVRVVCAPADPGSAPDLRRLGEHRNGTFAAPHEDWSFAFHDLEPGTYHVAAGRDSRRMDAAVVVEVRDAMVSADIALPPVPAAETFTARVFDPAGKALSGATFTGGVRTGNDRTSNSLTVLAEKDGVYTVAAWAGDGDRMRREAGNPSVEWFVAAEYPDYAPVTVSGGAPGGPELTIRFLAAARLVVAMPGFGASTLKGKVRIDASKVDPSGLDGTSSSREMPDNGRVTLERLSPGRWRVAAFAGSKWSTRTLIHAPEIDLVAGENAVTLPLPVLHALTVVLDAKNAGEPVTLRSDRERGPWFQSHATVADDGRAVFEDVPAGVYEVQARRGKMEVTLPGPETVVFRALVLNALRVRIRDAAGRMAAAGFRDGDLIIGLDGVEFPDEEAMTAALRASTAKDEVTCLVLRNGTVIEVRAPTSVIGRRNSGGETRPVSR